VSDRLQTTDIHSSPQWPGNFLRCLPYVNLPTDAPWWVAKSAFLEHFDQNDFLCRHIKSVTDAYLKEWFHGGPDETRYFNIAPVSVINGKTQFISGRHRTAVLLAHLERIPLSFAMRDIRDADRDWIHSVALTPIDTHTLIDLPNLPIKQSLP
jgi:hypothetical protein